MAAIRAARDIAYGPDPRHRLDLYTPEGKPRGAIVDLHGGGWWTGDKGGQQQLAAALAGAGYLVAAPNYRLADGAAKVNLYPTQIEDVGAVLGWLRAADLDFDRKRIGAVGMSSGGNLAVEAGLRHGIPAAAWSGLLDLDGFLADHPATAPKRVDPGAGHVGAEIDQTGPNDPYYLWLIGNLLGGDLTFAAEASPIHRVSAAAAGPMYLAGSLAELVPAKEIALMSGALIGAGIPVETLVLAGQRHAAGYFADALPGTLAFLARYVG
jgi:acetyl esterase/lipase